MDPWEDSRDDPLLGSVLDGRYRIIECVGAGGMGRVYRARHDSSVLGRDVAIKVLDTSSLQSDLLVRRFENEAKILAELRHPNTLKLIDSGRLPDGRLYIVTELLRGETLDEVLDRGALAVQATIEVLSQVCDSLAEAHARGIIHRDLKPGNIFLERVGEQTIVRVLDFGIAKLVHQPGLTAPLQIFGTPSYMSPEQAMGGVVDARADIYALGVVAYECLVGRPPFVDPYPMSVIRKHVAEAPVPVREALRGRMNIDPELAALVDRMLEKQPARRPQRVQEVREALNRAQLRITGRGVLPDLATDLVLAPPEEVLDEARRALEALKARGRRDPSRDTTPDAGDFDERTPFAPPSFDADGGPSDALSEGEWEPTTVGSTAAGGGELAADVLEAPSVLTTRSEPELLDPAFLLPVRAPSVGPAAAAELGGALERTPLPLGEAVVAEQLEDEATSAAPELATHVDRPRASASVEASLLPVRPRAKLHEVLLLVAALALLAVAGVLARSVLTQERSQAVGVRQLQPQEPKVLPKTVTATAAIAAEPSAGPAAVSTENAAAPAGAAAAGNVTSPASAASSGEGSASAATTKLSAKAARAGRGPSSAPVRVDSRDGGALDPGRDAGKRAPPEGFMDTTE